MFNVASPPLSTRVSAKVTSPSETTRIETLKVSLLESFISSGPPHPVKKRNDNTHNTLFNIIEIQKKSIRYSFSTLLQSSLNRYCEANHSLRRYYPRYFTELSSLFPNKHSGSYDFVHGSVAKIEPSSKVLRLSG